MRAAKIFSGPGLIGIGILHFLMPKPFEDIVPEALPAKRALVYASGVTEIATGLGSLHPRTRRFAGLLREGGQVAGQQVGTAEVPPDLRE